MKKYDKMKKIAIMNDTAGPPRSDGSCVTCDQLRIPVTANHVGLRAQHGGNTNSQGRRARPVSTVSTPNVAPRSHQRRWSADLCKTGTSPVITVRKSKKEPQLPQRGASLLQLHTASSSSVKRYSCPPIEVSGSRSPPGSSSSSGSTSSCSSPPPVPTSVITGHDPLGWKMQPKSSSTSLRTHKKRLSLQISLPVIFPDSKSDPAPNSLPDNTPNPDPAPKTKAPLRPKPSRRHSDSSAFLRSLATPRPVLTVEDLQAVHLRPLPLSDEPDDVFSAGKEEEVKVTPQQRKIPPPVPVKTALARQIAQLIADSHQCGQPVKAKTDGQNIYTSVVKPVAQHPDQTKNHSSLHMRKTAGLCVDPGCDRERSTPRFPG